MNSATGGAADPRQADNSTVKQQQRAPSPARFKDATSKTPSKTASAKSASTKQGGKNSRSSSPVAASAGKDRQATKGAAAVHPSGAESPTTRRSEKAKKIEERHSSTEDADDPPSKGDRVVSDQPSSSKSSQSKGKNQRGREGAASCAKPASNTVGCGPGFWREGCLQSELIQFHMNKSLKKEGAMHAKAATSPGNGMELSPEAPVRPIESHIERDLRDEIEKLNDENDDLKVGLDDSKQLIMMSYKYSPKYTALILIQRLWCFLW